MSILNNVSALFQDIKRFFALQVKWIRSRLVFGFSRNDLKSPATVEKNARHGSVTMTSWIYTHGACQYSIFDHYIVALDKI
jgi:hypothetical protein